MIMRLGGTICDALEGDAGSDVSSDAVVVAVVAEVALNVEGWEEPAAAMVAMGTSSNATVPDVLVDAEDTCGRDDVGRSAPALIASKTMDVENALALAKSVLPR